LVLDVVGEPAAIDNPKTMGNSAESLGRIDMQRGRHRCPARGFLLFLTGPGRACSLGLLQLARRLGRPTTAHPDDPAVAGAPPRWMARYGFLGPYAPTRCTGLRPTISTWWHLEVPLAGLTTP